MSALLPSLLKNTLPTSLQNHWDDIEKSHADSSVNSVRINPYKQTSQFDSEQNIPWTQYGKYLKHRPSFTFDPLFHAGCYYVQEASSMFLEHALKQYIDFEKQLHILDLCAAPGGKSTHVSSLISKESLLISNEIIGTRVNILAENMDKWGQINTWVCKNDPSHFKKTKDIFDVILIDAPCSGSGLFRKIPAYSNSWNLDLVNLCAKRQQRIVHDVYNALVQNGYICYMTCSLSKQENEEMLDYMMQHFELESCKINLDKNWGIVETQSEKANAFGYRFFSHLLQGEGFFLALLRKKDGNEKKLVVSQKKVNNFNFDLKKYIDDTFLFTFLQNEHLIAIQNIHKPIYEELLASVKFTKKGILIGKPTQKDLIPSHEFALSSQNIYNELVIDLDLPTAIKYLKKENIEISLGAKGWYLVTYQKKPIGWLKNIGNRINNYYPLQQRILSQKILPS